MLCVSVSLENLGSRVTSREKGDWNRCAYLTYRGLNGFDKRDIDKKKPIPGGNALQEWKELLEKRFQHASSGGTPFVLKVARLF